MCNDLFHWSPRQVFLYLFSIHCRLNITVPISVMSQQLIPLISQYKFNISLHVELQKPLLFSLRRYKHRNKVSGIIYEMQQFWVKIDKLVNIKQTITSINIMNLFGYLDRVSEEICQCGVVLPEPPANKPFIILQNLFQVKQTGKYRFSIYFVLLFRTTHYRLRTLKKHV